jgi:hypothetical protein
MPTVTLKNLSLNNAEEFKKAFTTADPTIGYVFIGRHIPWSNEAVPNTPVDNDTTERDVWQNMFAAKRITGNDVEQVIPRIAWTGNTKYRSYDNDLSLDVLASANTSQNLKQMYVITTDRNVYKCVANNAGANSTIQPTGDYGTSNGTILTADGFIWKYMYNVKPSNRFLTDDWIPAPKSTDMLDYNVSSTGVIDGQITNIVVVQAGSGYSTVTKNAVAFISNTAIITLSTNTQNLVANMAISGTGISTGTYITAVDAVNVAISLSTSTVGIGGGTANTLTFSSRVYISGDGVSATAVPVLSGNTISKITMSSYGSGYNRANVTIYGNGSAATARVIINSKYGHAYNPAHELCANNVMVAVRIGEIDSTENGLISANTSFRQFGLLRNPNKYGQTVAANNSTANTVISQTTDVTIVSGSEYQLNEFVYQGDINNPSYSGYINAKSGNTVRLTNIIGIPSIGLRLFGASSAVGRTLVATYTPEFEPNTGDIMYIDNIIKTERSDGQSENIKFVVKF